MNATERMLIIKQISVDLAERIVPLELDGESLRFRISSSLAGITPGIIGM